MGLSILSFLILLLGCVCASPTSEDLSSKSSSDELNPEKDDLKTAESNTLTRRSYSDYNNPSYYANYGGVTGYGSIDDSRYNSYGGGGLGYDNTYGYSGYGQYPGGYGASGFGNSGYGGSYGYNRGYGGGYGGGYGLSNYGGNGGYGGWGGNGGTNSYYGYNNPYYQGANQLGYGYYNRRGPGNIYQSGVTPSLVTGYRGYSGR